MGNCRTSYIDEYLNATCVGEEVAATVAAAARTVAAASEL